MHQQSLIIRLVAVVVLMTSALDYCAFDVWDPTAPMSSNQSEAIRDLVPERIIAEQTSVKGLTSELADDQCLCCAPSISPRPLALQKVTLNASVFQAAGEPIPSSDRIIPKRPPRA